MFLFFSSSLSLPHDITVSLSLLVSPSQSSNPTHCRPLATTIPTTNTTIRDPRRSVTTILPIFYSSSLCLSLLCASLSQPSVVGHYIHPPTRRSETHILQNQKQSLDHQIHALLTKPILKNISQNPHIDLFSTTISQFYSHGDRENQTTGSR